MATETTVKDEPVFENICRYRVMLTNKGGAAFWLEPGQKVTGERYRAFIPVGLKEVKAPKTFPAKAAPTPAAKQILAEVLAPESKSEETTAEVSDPTNFPFACDSCTHRAATASGLKNHKRIHQAEKA